MTEFLLIVAGGVIVLFLEYACFQRWWKRRRRFTGHESLILQSMAFLQSERVGEGAESTLTMGNDIYEDWEHLAAFETLLADGYIQRQAGPNKYGLSARGQLVAVRLFERTFPILAQ